MSTALERAREAYEQTPRKLDAQLEHRARGDRGCLFDLISLGGILVMFGCLVASQMGLIAFSWTYLGAAIWVGSYFAGLTRQSKSAKTRRAALEAGPLVLGAVVRCSPHLRSAGNKRSGRAAVVFCLEAKRRFDGPWLRRVAEALADWPAPNSTPDAAQGPVPSRRAQAQRVLHEDFHFACVEVSGETLDGLGPLPEGTWVARVVVDPATLEAPLSGRAAELPLIVEPTRSFVEQV